MDKDELLSSLDVEVVHVHLFHSFALLKSTSVHGCESVNGGVQINQTLNINYTRSPVDIQTQKANGVKTQNSRL